ncbi:hypothetical protein [Cupriavidus sp. BIS7]|uniref:hypothetical protein n=1 Tax=Cupriavidus sp. BIS7 TaxID=1217718 RepID=UPI001ED95EE5|nr:hypothetical protein [Cupriavidus sp. BIS7]
MNEISRGTVMIINSEMQRLLLNSPDTCDTNSGLSEIADMGFQVVGDCYLLSAMLEKERNVDRRNFQDGTGFECFVNSLHVEDYDDVTPLPQAIQFLSRVFEGWNSTSPSSVLVAFVSADELSVVVKFHVQRVDESWLSDNLDGYIDAIMSIDSTEDVRSVIRSVVSQSKAKE